jgi:hypothetical protein
MTRMLPVRARVIGSSPRGPFTGPAGIAWRTAPKGQKPCHPYQIVTPSNCHCRSVRGATGCDRLPEPTLSW